jgi:hypothetical protein
MENRILNIEKDIFNRMSGMEKEQAVTNHKLGALLDLVREIKDDHRRDIMRIDGNVKELDKRIESLKEQQIGWKAQIALMTAMSGGLCFVLISVIKVAVK